MTDQNECCRKGFWESAKDSASRLAEDSSLAPVETRKERMAICGNVRLLQETTSATCAGASCLPRPPSLTCGALTTRRSGPRSNCFVLLKGVDNCPGSPPGLN